MNTEARGNRSLDLLKKEKNMTFYFIIYLFIFVVEVMELGKGMKTLKQREY